MTTTNSTPAPGLAAAAPRQSLAQRVGSIENPVTVIGSVLLPLGLLIVLLGWYGAAHTPNLFEQIPYLISGGLLGIAVVFAGGLLYFSSWIARSAREQSEANAAVLAALHEIRDELRAQPAPTAVPAQLRTRSRGSVPVSNGNGAPHLVATSTGHMLHRPDCSVVVRRDDLHDVEPTTPGLKPCRLCDPLATTAAGASA